jgi:thiol-disulfide isomerase/thioredoxin
MYRYIIGLCYLALATQTVFCQTKPASVRLYGKIANGGSSIVLEDFSDLQMIVPKSYNKVVEIRSDSTFDITVPLKSPNYFRLSRNKLYLTPGDSLEVYINVRGGSEGSWFKGRGEVVNNYLRNVVFPKAGSYLEAGANLQPTPAKMLEFINDEAGKRKKALEELKGTTPAFIKLEKARIRADMIRSIDAVKAYASYSKKIGSESQRQAYVEEFEKISKPLKDSLLTDFAEPDFLKIEVYRDIINQFDTTKIINKAAAQIFKDWNRSYDLAFKQIKPENDKTKLPLFQKEINGITTARYRNMLNLLMAEKMKYGNGDPVIDFAAYKPDGSTDKLSSLKGKVIYIDLWATWCGPCLAEMPHLETLKKKYAGRDDIAIVSLSIDENINNWIKNLKDRQVDGIQWRIDRALLGDYGVETIPRYILINKEFKVAELNAPHASDQQVSALIDGMLKK